MAENLQNKITSVDEMKILSLLADDKAFREVFLDDPFKTLSDYNLSYGKVSALVDIMNYLPVYKPNSRFNEKLVLCSAAPA
jgi:hypothetical protein